MTATATAATQNTEGPGLLFVPMCWLSISRGGGSWEPNSSHFCACTRNDSCRMKVANGLVMPAVTPRFFGKLRGLGRTTKSTQNENARASIPVDYYFRTFFRFLSSIRRALGVGDSLTARPRRPTHPHPPFRQFHTSPIPVTAGGLVVSQSVRALV